MIPEKILINLKIISHIQKNEKLTKSFNGFISIDHQSSYQFINDLYLTILVIILYQKLILY